MVFKRVSTYSEKLHIKNGKKYCYMKKVGNPKRQTNKNKKGYTKVAL